MAKQTLKGIITEVGVPAAIGTKGTMVQNIVLLKKGYVNEFGEKESPDEEWQLQLFNKGIQALNIGDEYVFKKVDVEFWTSSRRVTGQNGKPDWFSVTNKLLKVEVIGDASQAADANGQMPDAYYADIANGAPTDDGLPF